MNEAKHKMPHVILFHFHEMSKICKSIETQRRLVVTKGVERGEWGVTPNEIKFLFRVMKMFWNYVVLMVVQLC